MLSCLESKRVSVQKAEEGSQTGRVESPEGELCPLVEQPNHQGRVPSTAVQVGQRNKQRTVWETLQEQ